MVLGAFEVKFLMEFDGLQIHFSLGADCKSAPASDHVR